MNKIDVLYTTDKNYLTITLASILSLAMNSNFQQEENITIHLMTEGLDQDDYRLTQEFKELCPNLKIIDYPLEEFDIAGYGIPKWRNTQVANARLFFQDVLGNKTSEIDRLLYLDADTIIVGDLSPLQQKPEPIYAVDDSVSLGHKKSLGVDRYFNSGVILLDVESWLREKYQERIKEFIRNNPVDHLLYPDQDILNIILKDKVTSLPRNYNMPSYSYALKGKDLSKYCKKYGVPVEQIEEGKKDPKILHSTGLLGIKPWMKNNIHPYNDVYRQYIYEANPSFELQSPNEFTSFLVQHPNLFYPLFMLKLYLPRSADRTMRKVLSNIEIPQKVKKKGDNQ